MHILVLDTIHGGKTIGEAFAARGDYVDCVDVYRGESTIDVKTALTRNYDVVVAPVHLDPDHPLLKFSKAPVISHHEAVHRLLGKNIPEPMVEITGARGKTTTAHALAFLMEGPGILQTSTGTYRFPEKNCILKCSITPGSVLAAVRMAQEINGWLIVEESLGISCAGTLGIITSAEDYSFAAGKKTALQAKVASAKDCAHLLLAEDIPLTSFKQVVNLEDVATCKDTECSLSLAGKTCRFSNPLLALAGYRTSLMLAAAAAMILGIDPEPLSSFSALAGRMSVSYEQGVLVVDNANSGTNLATTVQAAQYARSKSGKEAITLVIGQMEGDGAVCEGFPFDQIQATINQIRPTHVVWVGTLKKRGTSEYWKLEPLISSYEVNLEKACISALRMTKEGSIVLAVKTWR
ncbi:MAG: coenzyme F430 synthase [Methanoregula sp.]|jgi:UDP-N-acetylmuramyl pentapeptide synthase|nr:coenzyme F430 synthase [Methanoregula sp.]